MMNLPPLRIAGPSEAPVTLDQAKAHLAIDHDEHDARIQLAIDAAVDHLDGLRGVLGRALVTQTWRESMAFWPASRCFPLALAPVLSVEKVTARTAAGSVEDLPQSDWRVLAGESDPRLLLSMSAALPDLEAAPDAVTITYQAGYGGPDAVPAAIRAAILMMVGDQYRFTETAVAGSAAVVPMSVTVDRLITPFRRVMVS